jgi:hypothetical protein
MTPDQFEFPGFPTPAEQARDQGINQVLENNSQWAVLVMCWFQQNWLPSKPHGFEFIGEDFRREASACGIPQPRHHNAWGGIFSHISRHPEIENTGRTRQMRDVSSHARRSFIYRKKEPA